MSTSTASLSPAVILKQETTGAHQNTEKALVSRIKSISGAEDYCSLLGCLYGYFSPIETAIDAPLSRLFPDHAQRRKSDRLKQDILLLNLGYSFRTGEVVKGPMTDAVAIGYAYVMEGSVLGGAIIKKMISERFPEIPPAAFGFFSGYGDENKTMWANFLEVLNRELQPAAAMREGLQGADACFTGMERWINKWYGGTKM